MILILTESPLNNSVSEVSRKSTVGSLDMGGGSAQIAFEVGKSVSTQRITRDNNDISDSLVSYLNLN